MAMQYDVLSAHTNVSAQMVVGRTRVKGIVLGGAAGTVNFWDATKAPVAVTYARSAGGVITITKNAHGYQPGQKVGLTFAAGTGGQATNGNYVILTVATNTYTVQDINVGAINAGANANENTRWLFSVDNADTVPYNIVVPGEGMLADNGVYAQLASVPNVEIFYG
jgi:hypothetical protein